MQHPDLPFPPAPRPTEVAFTVERPDGSTARLRIEFDLFVDRLAGLSEALLAAVASRRGREARPLPPAVLRDVIDGLLAAAATQCVIGDNAEGGNRL